MLHLLAQFTAAGFYKIRLLLTLCSLLLQFLVKLPPSPLATLVFGVGPGEEVIETSYYFVVRLLNLAFSAILRFDGVSKRNLDV